MSRTAWTLPSKSLQSSEQITNVYTGDKTRLEMTGSIKEAKCKGVLRRERLLLALVIKEVKEEVDLT